MRKCVNGAVSAGQGIVNWAQTMWENAVNDFKNAGQQVSIDDPNNLNAVPTNAFGEIKQAGANIIDKTKEIGWNIVDKTKEIVQNPVEYIDNVAWSGVQQPQQPVPETENTTNLDNLQNAA